MTGLPSKRSIGTCVSAATIMQSASAISALVSTFLAPPEPLVSTLMRHPNSAAFFSRLSAAIYVCAIPVGHPVTARISLPPFVSAFAGTSLDSSASFALSATSMTCKNSSTLFAFRRSFVNFSSISSTESLLSTSRCTLSLVFGAAIKKIRSAFSPSSDWKSTPPATRIAASPGAFTTSDLQ